jgi:ketosteroid isomerase-like protein
MSPARMAKLESSMRLVLEFNDAFNSHDVEGMMKLMSEDCVFENTDPAPDGTRYSGRDAVTQFWQNFFRDSPHAHIEIEEIFGLALVVSCAGSTVGSIQLVSTGTSAG